MSLQADGNRKYPNSKLLVSSAGRRGWSSIYAELRSHPVGRIVSLLQQNVEIVVALHDANDGFVTRCGAGRQDRTRPSSGMVWLVPVSANGEEVILTTPLPKTLHIYLSVRPFNLLADQYNLPQSLVRSIQYLGGLNDELIYQIGLSVVSEMKQETSTGRMFVETASLMLAAQLSHHYLDLSLLKSGRNERLENDRLRRVLDYIDAHLESEISVAALADVAALSAFHFARMFAATIGMPPRKYVSQRRLENAMAMLAAGKLSLAEIAHRSCFSSQAAFSRGFRQATGVTPGEYRRLAR